jgi:hypothetical protein
MKSFMQVFMMQCQADHEEQCMQMAQQKATQVMIQIMLMKLLGIQQPQVNNPLVLSVTNLATSSNVTNPTMTYYTSEDDGSDKL